MYLVRSGAVEGFDALVRKLGSNPTCIKQNTGLRPIQFRDPNSFLALSKLAHLLEAASRSCNAPLFGALLADHQDWHVLGELPINICQEPTVEDAILKFARILFLHAGGIEIVVIPKRQQTQIQFRYLNNNNEDMAQLYQLSLGQLTHIFISLSGSEGGVLSLHLKQKWPESDQIFSRKIFSTIQFSSTFDGISVNSAVLKIKPRPDEDMIKQHFDNYLHHLKNNFPNSISDQLKSLIGRMLASSECTLNNIAQALDLHPRELQRRLQDEGTSYITLMHETREKIAKEYLEKSDITITNLALNLGFAETASFTRTFRMWTGLSPKAWRYQQRKKS
ncbi:MAG: helix-turn-helix domain-containing protein [Zhongshania sp.]|uniref:AraC family transcriptional regulator n=1 Tax=Zhongshania sp. TaxID=1971902 RepID=UPI00262B0120|nr:response regulator transcription factor [Zhongshania sp.]MDF1693166.1 helix-turn-helix domain-containing protein [Zhongshania sp.]